MAVAVSVLGVGSARQSRTALQRFRQGWHAWLARRADALFELTDALLATGPAISLPYLSLDGLHRRGHGSAYAALARGRVDTEAARGLPAGLLPGAAHPVFAVDVSVWARSDAECSPGRGYSYHPFQTLGGAAGRGRLGLLLAGRPGTGHQLMDRAGGRPAAGPGREPQRRGRRPGPRAAAAAPRLARYRRRARAVSDELPAVAW
ncbi:transposase [Streptomyces rimosus]|uniref:transposase n=1 Tax=Streptomyces rimosus TaxID=1927 RepID=UPI003CD00FFA